MVYIITKKVFRFIKRKNIFQVKITNSIKIKTQVNEKIHKIDFFWKGYTVLL